MEIRMVEDECLLDHDIPCGQVNYLNKGDHIVINATEYRIVRKKMYYRNYEPYDSTDGIEDYLEIHVVEMSQ